MEFVLGIGCAVAAVVTAVAFDHASSLRRLREARLLDDPRYGAAVELVWERGESATAYYDAIELLVDRGVGRAEAGVNLTRILGSPGALALLANSRRRAETPQPVSPWDRVQTPATSSSFILPLGRIARTAGTTGAGGARITTP